jgi:DNA-binding PadR family transcriptional regulator
MLGEFEYLLITAAASLGDNAYGAFIRHEIASATGRNCSIGALYTTLDDLEAKGLLHTWISEATPLRGGRSKRMIRITPSGLRAAKDFDDTVIRISRSSYRAISGMGRTANSLQASAFHYSSSICPFWIVLLAASASFSTLAAQQAPGRSRTVKGGKPSAVAELDGRAVGQTGIPVSGAIVSIENLETHQIHTAKSTAEGAFRFSLIPTGEYKLTATATGYKAFLVPQLPLVAGDDATANVLMEPGNSAEFVIGSVTSVVSRVGTALAGKSVSDLPENQRNFVNLVQVSSGATEGSTNNAASGSRPGAQHQSSAVSVGGQSEMTNNSMIDGIDNNERINAEIAVHPSVESIESVRIFANAYPASMGRAGGGVINVIIKT